MITNLTVSGVEENLVKLVGHSILDIGYSILEHFLSPAHPEHSLSLMSYGLKRHSVLGQTYKNIFSLQVIVPLKLGLKIVLIGLT